MWDIKVPKIKGEMQMSERLKGEVWDLDRCTGCGLCVAVCNKGVLEFDDSVDRHPTIKKFQRLVGYREVEVDPCKLCEEPSVEVCPRLVDWEQEKLGKTFSLKSNVTGDVIKDLLLCGLELGAIDRVIAVDMDKWSSKPVPKLLRSPEDVKDSPLIVPLFSAGLKMINKVRRVGRVAVVGPPCWAQGLKRLEKSTLDALEPFRKPVYLKISYFCYGTFYPDVLPMVENLLNLPLWSISKIEVANKGSKFVFHSKGERTRIPMTEIAKFMAKGCARCTDFVGEQSDIAIGSVGSEPGLKTAIIRSPLGEKIVSAASKMHYVDITSPVSARKELTDFIEAKKKRGSAVEVDKAFLSIINSLKKPEIEEGIIKKMESLFGVKKEES